VRQPAIKPTRRQVLLLTSITWLLLGIAALAVHLGFETAVGMFALIYPAVPLYVVSSGFGHSSPTHGLLWDSAHGPPFLTTLGVIVVYFFPSVLGWWRFRHVPGPAA
jgi:hypothetical protein